MGWTFAAARTETEPGKKSTFSSILETDVISRNTSKCAIVFQVLSPAIKEEKFLSWLQSEPPILLWLPTCYRLSATEMVTHPVRCRICRNFPITGLRYSHSSVLHRQSFSRWAYGGSFVSPDSFCSPSHTSGTQLIFFRVDNFLHEGSWVMINYVLLSIISGILNSSIDIYSHQKTFLFI